MKNYKNKKVLILGLGVSGRAAAAFLLRRGASVSGIDQNKSSLEHHDEIKELHAKGLQLLWNPALLNFKAWDEMIVSPGVPNTNPFYEGAILAGLTILGETELGFSALNQPCIGITGSNGKTTATLLIEHVLNSVGKKAKAVGNIGTPLTSVVDSANPEEILVVELSSWQLETLKSRKLDAAVLLNITPNHLDRHGTLEKYAEAKINMGNCLKTDKKLIVGAHVYEQFKPLLEGFSLYTYGYSPTSNFYCDKQSVFKDEKLEFILPSLYRDRVTHDVENMMAAYAALCEMGVTAENFLQAFNTFKKPPHRIEFVKKIKNVAYYNDSKGTSLDAVAKAVKSLQGDSILIAGGRHKGASYCPWINDFEGHVRFICAIGEAATLIKSELGHFVPVEIFDSLESAVIHASKMARDGENVLLSPGCSSYDMFKDYAHRGEEFKRIVYALT